MHILYSDAWGGLELYVTHYIRKLIDAGIPGTLYCRAGSRVDKEARLLKIPVLNKNKWMAALDVAKFTHVHAHQRQDLPIIRMWLIGKNNPLIYSLYMMAPPKHDIYHRWIYSRVNAIMSSSELVCTDIKKNFPIPTNRVHLIRYGRDLHIQRSPTSITSEIKKQWHHDSKKMIFGSLCRIDPGKGVQDIAAALSFLDNDSLNKMELWFVGDPTLAYTNEMNLPVYEEPSQKLYDQLIQLSQTEKFKNVIKLIPYQKKYHDYLSAMDVFVLGSHGETYSIAVIDAMQIGLPVIGTRSGGTIEQIGSNDRGTLVAVKSPQEIANAIHEYIKNPSLIKERGSQAKIWSDAEHSWNKTLQQTLEIYENLLA